MANEQQERSHRIAARRSSLIVYGCIRVVIKLLLFPYFRVQHRGGEHLDVDGPVIVAPVHRSNLDSPLIAGVGHRRMRALAKESLFDNVVFAWLISALGAFPLRRGEADREAMRAAREVLERGEQMIVFPEGTRQTGPKVAGVFDGMSYLASKSGAAIVPVGVAGTEAAMASGRKIPRRVPVAIVAGPPIRLPSGRLSRPELSRLSERVANELQTVFDEAQELAASRR